jgi:hypothetical protein
MVKQLIDPESSSATNATFFSILVGCDPEILTLLQPGTKLRVQSLLRSNAETMGVSRPYRQIQNPAYVLGACLKVLGEEFMLGEMVEFTSLVVGMAPYAPEFISAVTGLPKTFTSLFDRYLDRASSSQFSASNGFARAVEAMDGALANATTYEQAFTLLAAILRGAELKGNGPSALANSNFESLAGLKAKARSYASGNPGPAAAIMAARHVDTDYTTFLSDYLG